MIRIICGSKGSGKTKTIISQANESINKELGDIVFITDTQRYIHDIKYQIRFTNAKDSDITTEDGFIGFIQGMLEANYDIRFIFIDGASRMIGKAIKDMASFFTRLELISSKTEAIFTLTVSESFERLPDFIKKYM